MPAAWRITSTSCSAGTSPRSGAGAKPAKTGGKQSAKARAQERFIKSEIARTEKAIAQLQAQCSQIDQAMYEPANSARHLADKTMSELLAERAQVAGALEQLEAEWLALSERLEGEE